jgi:hypothetical protein
MSGDITAKGLREHIQECHREARRDGTEGFRKVSHVFWESDAEAFFENSGLLKDETSDEWTKERVTITLTRVKVGAGKFGVKVEFDDYLTGVPQA